MSWQQVKRATVAIAAADGNIRGTGFFVSSDGYLLTCAHVVEAAGGWEQVRVQGKSVSLVYLGNSQQDDFAVLQITGYQGEGVPLSLCVTPMHRFLSIGYGRPDFPEGASIDGAITDINPQANFGNLSMLRLRVMADAQRVQGGYRGSPVFDAETQLEQTIREENTPTSLPVVTIGTVGRLSNREYRERCAARLAEIIMYPENSIGVGRIFIP